MGFSLKIIRRIATFVPVPVLHLASLGWMESPEQERLHFPDVSCSFAVEVIDIIIFISISEEAGSLL